MKLFDSIMKNFNNDSLGLLGAVLGEHEVKVRDGIEAAVPEILSAIGSQTKSQEGRDMLWRELRDTDESVASSFPSQLHYQNSLPLVEKGKQQLSGLIGHDIDAITNRVSHAADIGSSSASKVVGAVSPLIFSSLAAWQKKENVDAEGWQKLFAEQGEGLRERAVQAATRKFDAKTGQRTFPSFDKTISTGKGGGDEKTITTGISGGDDKKITTGKGGGDDKWTSGAGFTPGYSGSADEKFHASGLTSESPNGNTKPIGKVAAGVAGAAAVVGVAAAGGKAMGAASGKTVGATASAKVHSSSFAAKSDSTGEVTKTSSTTEDQTRWVPDKENLKRERERTAIEKARSEREARLAKEKSGGLGWLWWQMALLAAVAGLGWFFRGEISSIVNKATPVAKTDLDVSGDSDSTLQLDYPSASLQSEEAAAADVVEDLDAQTDETSAAESTAPQDTTSNNQSDDTLASNGMASSGMASSSEASSGVASSSEASSSEASSGVASSGEASSGVASSSEASSGVASSSEASSGVASSSEASSGVVEGAIANTTTGENGAPQLSSPLSASKSDLEDLDLPATKQSDDAPKLAPMDHLDATQKLDSAVKDSATVAADSTAQASDDEDVDLQVETALTSLELGIKNIKDEASAKTALPKMEKCVTTLEDLLETSSTWEDVDKELIDIQLEEAAGVFGKLKESVSSMPNVKGVVTPLFGRLEKLLPTPQVAP